MKRKRTIILIICAGLLAVGLYSCSRYKAPADSVPEASPAVSPEVEAADSVNSPEPTESADGSDTASDQIADTSETEENADAAQDAGEPESAAPEINEDIVAPELDIPEEPSGSDGNTAPEEGQGEPEPQNGEQEQEGEQEGENGIVVTENGDILLPELP